MKFDESTGNARNRRTGPAGFTLIEVVFAAAIAAMVLAGMFEGYRCQYVAGHGLDESSQPLAAQCQRQLRHLHQLHLCHRGFEFAAV